jgi:hypothetical protein
MKKKMRFALERTTKTTVRYSELGVYADADSTDWKPVSETGHDMTVGYLYVKKAAFR